MCTSEMQQKVNCRLKVNSWPIHPKFYSTINFQYTVHLTFSCNSLVCDPGHTYTDILHIFLWFQAWWGNLYVSIRLFFQSCFFNWLLNEGFYLCRRVTSDVFNVDVPFRLFHTFGWGKFSNGLGFQKS